TTFLTDASETMVNKVVEYVGLNSSKILNTSAIVGKAIMNFFIAFILSVYLLVAKSSIKKGAKRLFSAVFKPRKFEKMCDFWRRCNRLINKYVVYNILDALIVGVVNSIFMIIAGMQYVGLVSVVVAVTNLVPTFGPFVGAGIGGFILLMVNPSHALVFLIFTLVLQIIDGYILKPKLFGDSLGVSGLLILIAIILGGKVGGIIGILVSVPVVAIIDFIYKENLLPMLEKRRKKLNDEADDWLDPEADKSEIIKKITE
ncbi:MAG: AI-2E family transporter, partial [Lachnospiraceae bacterium]|nr:AI-2E family transporter [Lachnospiraceae bacterium]